MARGRKNKKDSTPPPSTATESPPSTTTESPPSTTTTTESPSLATATESPSENSNKTIYLCINTRDNFDTWAKLDSIHGHLQMLPEMNLPQDIPDLYEFLGQGRALSEDKIYFIGGLSRHGDRLGDRLFTDKVFIYNLTSHKWVNTTFPRLNLARALPNVFIINNIIYVCGGMTGVQLSSENWMEVYDLNNQENKKWTYLRTCVPVDLIRLLKLRKLGGGVVYEHGHQILFFAPLFGIFSFNYLKHTWNTFVDCFIDDLLCFNYGKASVVQHLFFGALDATVYVFDLSKKKLLLRHHAFDLGIPREYPTPLHLFHVGNDSLLLIWIHEGPPCEDCGISYCRIKIKHLPKDSGGGVRLVEEELHHFLPDQGLRDIVASFSD